MSEDPPSSDKVTVAALEASGAYRVLRKLAHRTIFERYDGSTRKSASSSTSRPPD
jgi:hypothetical protein